MLAEAALTAWDVGQSLPEFERRPAEEQNWLMATRRVKQKLDAVALAEALDRVG